MRPIILFHLALFQFVSVFYIIRVHVHEKNVDKND